VFGRLATAEAASYDPGEASAPAASAASPGSPVIPPAARADAAIEGALSPSPRATRVTVPPPAAARPQARRRSARVTLAAVGEELVAWVKTLASAAVYATLIVTFGFQVARVEGQSMAPTLADQDRLIVNKLVYRITEPRRGDIVMLYYPLNPDKSFVKRVIAEEGDEVRIVDGRVFVNEVPLADDYVPPEFRSHENWGPQRIADGYYFVMGDHRNNSSDSRHWGLVPKRYIIGKVQVRWWPLPAARLFE
jgi:signal peptidase I